MENGLLYLVSEKPAMAGSADTKKRNLRVMKIPEFSYNKL